MEDQDQLINAKESQNGNIRTGYLLHGFFMLLVVGIMYVIADSKGHLPPGHPWSAITLSLLGIQSLKWGLQDRYKNLAKLGFLVPVAAIITAIVWVISDFG